jgi:hypothetical protein
MKRRLVLIGVMAVAVAVVIGASALSAPAYSGVSPAVIRYFKGMPPSVANPGGQQIGGKPKPSAAWAGPGTIYVMTWGSGSCPALPSTVKAAGGNLVVITTYQRATDGAAICTADLAVTTSVVRLPSRIDSTRPLTVRIDRATTHLEPRAR